MSEAEAREVLFRGGRATALVTIIESAWNAHIEEQRFRSARARASVVWDYMAQFADLHFAALGGVLRVEAEGGLPLYVVDGRLALRFKKLDRELNPRNVQTGQQRRIARQLALDGLQPLTYVSCGYVLDRANADVEKIMAVKHVGHRREWAIDLRELARGVLEPITPILPFDFTPDQAARPLPTIVPPRREKEDEE